MLNSDELRQAVDDLANNIDSITHEVPAWEPLIIDLLQSLELHAMANDPEHPAQFNNLLEQVREQIKYRIQKGSWPEG